MPAARLKLDLVEKPVNDMSTSALADQTKFVVAEGRGRTGKSAVLRTLKERAMMAGRDVAVADADRTNATLASFFADVVRPDYTDEAEMSAWLDELCNSQNDTRMTVILDIGASGHGIFLRFASELRLADLLTKVGIVPVSIHCIGPDPDDLNPLGEIQKVEGWCPPQTILLLNEALIKNNRPVDVAFADVRNSPIYQAALKRGAREVLFPRLACMDEINARKLSFEEAETKLGLTNRQRVYLWRQAVAKAWEPVADWLP